MENRMINNSLLTSLWDSFTNSIEHNNHNIMLVKYYNSFSFAPDVVNKLLSQENVIVIEHTFSGLGMQSVAEPFLDSIRKIYCSYFADDMTPEEFVENAGVYSVQRSVFATYIRDGIGVRYEDAILSEVKYERKKLMISIASILNYISQYKKVVFVLGNLHYANVTVLELIKALMSVDASYNINIFASFNEGHLIDGVVKSEWDELIEKTQSENRLFESGINEETAKNTRINEEFLPESANVREYIDKLINMVTFLCTNQADYYLKVLFQEIEKENVVLKPEDRISLLTLYAANSLYSFDMSKTLLLGEELATILTEDMHREKYRYLYIMALAQAHMTQINLANKYVAECQRHAALSGDDLLEFKSKALEYIVKYYSFVNLFYCDYTENLDESIIPMFDKYSYYNTLNYILTIGFENDAETVKNIVEGKQMPKYFNRAIESGRWLDNKEFLNVAYMKNIILYTEHGYHQYVEELYKKRLLVVKEENEIVKFGHMYNGLGYNCIIDEQYIQGNNYLNEALRINLECEQAESSAETLYNMAMNCICAWDYENAQKYLECALKIIKGINLTSIAVCNVSKLYGMLALCYFHMSRYYDSYLYVSKIELMARHILCAKTEPDYSRWDDDLFFYNMVRGLLAKHDKEYEKAEEYYNKADFHQKRTKGLQYYSVAQLALERADLYCEWKKFDEKKKVLEEAIEFCQENNFLSKLGILMNMLENSRYQTPKWDLPLTTTSLKAVSQMAERIGIRMQLKRKQKDIDFLTTWQETLGNENVSVEKMMSTSMMTIHNFFNLDGLLYIKNEAEKTMCCTDENLILSSEQIENLVNYFEEHTMAFVANRGEKLFFDYDDLMKILGDDRFASLIGIPVCSNEKLESVVIGYVNIHRNFTANKIVYNYDDLTILKFAFIQLRDAVVRINTRSELELVNMRLSQNAITDALTGLYNRQGFSEKIAEGFPEEKGYTSSAIAYIDFDNFKYYNDTFGHNVGDDILVTFSKIVMDILGNDGYMVRYGGDEFVAVMPGSTDKEATDFAKKLLKSFDKINERVKEVVPPNTYIPKEKALSASIGISSFEKCDDISVHTALNQADEALYFVKRTTKNDYMLYREIPKH